MADVKISGLPASTTPLAGTEVLPIVQGGQTRQVSVANLTAGRAVSATTVSASTSVTTPVIQATSSAGGTLKNNGGTAQLQWGSGGGSNLSFEVATNINPANAAVAISPTGTGTVAISPAGALTINPTTASTMNNVAIGGSTPLAITGTTITSTSLTASSAVATDGSKNLVSVTNTGSGSNVLAASPTLTSPYIDTSISTGYNSSSEAKLGVFGTLSAASVNGGAVYSIEWKMAGDATGQFWYANYITNGGARTLGAYCTGTTWTNSSDISNKENIQNITYGLTTAMALRPVNFNWKSQKDINGVGLADIGFIAQEVEKIVPEVVSGQEGSKGISYGNLVTIAIKAIQEQQEIIEELRNKVKRLELQ